MKMLFRTRLKLLGYAQNPVEGACSFQSSLNVSDNHESYSIALNFVLCLINNFKKLVSNSEGSLYLDGHRGTVTRASDAVCSKRIII